MAALDAPGGPEGFLTTLPVALDGSNSGVQHYSAIMRAEEGAYVNLTPQDAPADLYAKVAAEALRQAQRTARLVRQGLARRGRAYPTRGELVAALDIIHGHLEALESPEEAGGDRVKLDAAQKFVAAKMKRRRGTLCSLLWADEGITRSTVKRNVMTFGYSSVAYGMAQQIRQDYMEPLALRVLRGELPVHPFGADEGKAAAGWLGRTVYKSVCAVLPRVAEAMQWLRNVAGVMAAADKGVLLVTPMGFPMLMRETEAPTTTLFLRLLDRTVTPGAAKVDDRLLSGTSQVLKRLRCDLEDRDAPAEVDRNAQENGVAPNVIHTMDACHLMMVVARMRDHGVPDLLLIHDSFATHAGNVSCMSVTLREQLAALYENYCPLLDIHERATKVLDEGAAAGLPAIPDRGALSLWESVMNSSYAFS